MNKALFLKIGGGIKHKGAKLFAKKRRVRKGCLEYWEIKCLAGYCHLKE